ncbi:MAG: SRPBCC family protein [Caldilineaceae bacterium]|nr:SRPBCC family protein [Caldilineaceae bacterium]MCB0107806.1 SRPBCC family protein [Caldilineaceae bacterium]MCB0123052.1 SRPBCC family protein [Caldilineaceae bacterium]MCB0182837.1 SRPBCC family protein [Caldilineaceae bacterium]
MIHPRKELKSERYIHAAPAAVWQKFTQLHGWPGWYPEVSSVKWLDGDQWREGAHFALTNSQGETYRFVIRMVAPGSATVWESLSPALNAVFTFHCTDQVGGCKVTMGCTYHGIAALTVWLQYGRHQAQVTRPLDALKAHFDRK